MKNIIDVHVHLAPPEIIENREDFFHKEETCTPLYENKLTKMVTAEECLLNMDKNGVEKALVTGFPWCFEETAKLHNNWLLEQASKYKGRLYPLLAFEPLSPWGQKHAEEYLKNAFGLGELAIYHKGLNEEALNALEALGNLCQEQDKVFLMHVNEPMVLGHIYPGKAPIELSEIYQLVLRLPKTKLILAHFGGGLPFMASLKKNVKQALQNVRFDTAAMPYIYDTKALKMGIEVLGAEHFLLGSDYPLLNYERYLKYFKDSLLTAEEINKITFLNAQAFLGI